MKWTRRQVLSGIGVILLVAAVGAAGYFAAIYGNRSRGADGPIPRGALSAIRACGNERNLIECVRPIILELLDTYDAADIIRAIDRERLPLNRCHYVVHVIGQELYTRYGDMEKALTQCSRFCNAACPHGVIGEAFRVQLGLEEGTDLGHLDTEDVLKVGEQLCREVPKSTDITVRGTCHGVGHALFLAHQDLDAARASCGKIATGVPLADCYRGIYMEYTDMLSLRSSWQDLYQADQFPSVSELSTFCALPTREEADACFYYYSTIVRRAYQNEGIEEDREVSILTRTKPLCTAMTDPTQRRLCIFGFGTALYDILLADEKKAVDICSGFPSANDQSWCMAGMFSLVAEYGRATRAGAYCALLPEGGAQRATCWRALFEKIVSISGSVDDALRICPEGEKACTDSAEAAKRGDLHEFY